MRTSFEFYTGSYRSAYPGGRGWPAVGRWTPGRILSQRRPGGAGRHDVAGDVL